MALFHSFLCNLCFFKEEAIICFHNKLAFSDSSTDVPRITLKFFFEFYLFIFNTAGSY